MAGLRGVRAVILTIMFGAQACTSAVQIPTAAKLSPGGSLRTTPTAPATPDTEAPSISRLLWTLEQYYSAENPPCSGSEDIFVSALVRDRGFITDVSLRYRWLGKNGYDGEWLWTSEARQTEEGNYGFAISTDAVLDLFGGMDGAFEFSIHAVDSAGNTAVYPSEGVISVPMYACK